MPVAPLLLIHRLAQIACVQLLLRRQSVKAIRHLRPCRLLQILLCAACPEICEPKSFHHELKVLRLLFALTQSDLLSTKMILPPSTHMRQTQASCHELPLCVGDPCELFCVLLGLVATWFIYYS